LVPYLLKFSRKWFIVPLILLIAFVLSAIRLPLEIAYWKYLIKLPASELQFQYEWFWATLKYTIIMSIYAMLIRFSIDWFEAQKYKNELIKQQQASEISLLRSQINPHFLFNTLNNIYSLVYNKSEEAPEAVMKLSSLMRYMLYEANTELVPVQKELEYLNSFIELQQLRLNRKGFVDIQVNGSMDNKSIAPMLLIPFVENAFKHGDKTPFPGIKIKLFLLTDKLVFEVENYVKPAPVSINDESGGFGLENIRKRLTLLYPDKHELSISPSSDIFSIRLTIFS
jgi:LytS/YehU family sensor histidine kinase